MRIRSKLSVTTTLLAVPLVVLGLGACAPGSDSGAEPGASEETPQIAYFMTERANTYVSATLDGLTEEVEAAGGTVTAFDGQLDPTVQAAQIQDAIASGKYNGFLITAVDNMTLLPAVEQAIEAGIAVANTTSPIGPDIATGEAQVEGQTIAILTPSDVVGQQLGEATVQACEGIDPCKAVWVGGNAAVAFDKVKFDNYLSVVDQASNIEVVAETNGDYAVEPSRVAVQDILQVHPDVNVVTSLGEQGALGAAQAGEDEGKDFSIVGFGGTDAGSSPVGWCNRFVILRGRWG